MYPALSTEDAFARYEAIRARLPGFKRQDISNSACSKTLTPCPQQSVKAPDLGALADQFDVFVFDAFGVLNIGETPIAGARARIDALRAMGKRLFVLTNAASYTMDQTVKKFQTLGFDFTSEELVSSRTVCEQYLSAFDQVDHWGVIGPEDYHPGQLDVANSQLDVNGADYDQVDGFLFLSSSGWSRMKQTMLLHSLAANPRPVVVANPDLVAPREDGLSLEPGFFAHHLQDALPNLSIHFHGKPYDSVYQHIHGRLSDEKGLDPHRIAMLGDTLHTDILGAQACGWTGILVSDHGLFKGHDLEAYIASSGIVPDYIIPSI
ncbi:MAG: HAD-IIA family hydrolase [Cohaesibacter sp.]|nr:HAD-IIA family hydrolase [Cohaesibacter sp.]